MKDVTSQLSETELERLDRFLLDRIDEDANTDDKDEGVLDITELDGLFTAIASGPVMILPSQWLPVVWGDFEPVWESEKHAEAILSLMMRHMNSIATTLMEHRDDFEPLFLEHMAEGKTYTIVDEWCEGYLRGVALATDQWQTGGLKMTILLAPMQAFTTETKWAAHDLIEPESNNIRNAITPNVREIHAYWLLRRDEHTSGSVTVRRGELRVGRNDPCPCGSGKKYKKCCLH